MDQMNTMGTEPTKKSSSIFWIIAVVILVLIVVVWWWQSDATTEMEEPMPSEQTGEISEEVPTVSDEDTTPAIDEDLDSVDLTDLEDEFMQIDSDLENL